MSHVHFLLLSLGSFFVSADPANHAELWEDFRQKFGKFYSDAKEVEHRSGIFKANVDFILAENAKGHSYTLGVNQFADLTREEFSAQYLGFRMPNASELYGGAAYLGNHEWNGDSLPSSVDWTTKGSVTPIKNQGQCGSCWTFSATGALEGAYQLATGNLVSLSEQQIVDCDRTSSTQGCNGGSMDGAFTYVESHQLCTEDSYPYKAQDGTCRSDTSCKTGIEKGKVSGYKDVATRSSPASESTLKSAVAQQPVSVAIEADKSVFQLYKSGVLDGACGDNPDHGVLAVGYGTDPSGGDYWKIKNSWGASWGDNGFVRMKRGKGDMGECAVLSAPSYPVIASGPGPAPGPSPPSPSPPSPGPSPPGCADAEDSFFCQLTKEQNLCDLLAQDCQETCGCCVASPPSYCNQASKSTEYMKAREAVSSAVRAIVV